MHSIWAVATNTLKQALRMKIALVFIILLLVLLPAMGYKMTGDGTVKGRLQTFVSYGLSLTSLLLCLLTIIVSIYTLTTDLKQRQIYTVITKPIRRWQLLVGKLLGVILLDVFLLCLFCGLIYAITIYTPKYLESSDDEMAQLRNEFFTARASLSPPEVEVGDEVEKAYVRLKQSGRLDQLYRGLTRKEIIARLTTQRKFANRAAGPGRGLLWEFENVKPTDPNQSIFIRFKYDVSVNPPDLQVHSRWSVGDYRKFRDAQPIKTLFEEYDRSDAIRTFHEIEIPAGVVAEDGYLAVGFLNLPLNNTVVMFPPEDGLEVLYKADTFGANFVRAALLILMRLIFLAALGVLASTFLSFPVAILFCLVIFLTGTVSGFIIDSFDYLSADVGAVYSFTLKPIIRLLPEFDKFSPTKFLVPARLLSWPLLAKATLFMVCIKGFLLMIFALIIFSFKEIAKVIV